MNAEKTGFLIYELRNRKGLTQKELAEQCNVTDKAVSKWERGEGCPDVTVLPKLAEVFGVLFELCVDLEIPVEAVLAGTWKSTLNIKGKTRPEQKQAAQAWVLDYYNIKATQDEVDAICIGTHIIRQNINTWDDDE